MLPGQPQERMEQAWNQQDEQSRHPQDSQPTHVHLDKPHADTAQRQPSLPHYTGRRVIPPGSSQGKCSNQFCVSPRRATPVSR